ncbi:MAG: MFS transporter [Alphaproteobacteria bacterium]|nr:MFS transporter [Alphaproteobacteria bacterium]
MAIEPQPVTAGRRMKLVVTAAAAGTVFEWYDFFIYGSLAPIIAKHFFAAADPTQGYILTLLTFAAGFFARPFGAVIFGRLGDRTGRKRTFLITISVMGLATFLAGLLPDANVIGPAAPWLLVALRMGQGFAIGGEYGGAAIYVAEHALGHRRGSATGWIQLSASIGLLLALGAILIVQSAIGTEAFSHWGWRIPFLLSVILLGISLWIRLKLEESPLFQRIREEGGLAKAPLREALLDPRSLKRILIVLFGILTGQGVVWYLAQFYTLFYLEHVLKLDLAHSTFLIMAMTAITLPFYLLFASVSDRIGRKPLMLAGLLTIAIATFPIFHMLTEAVNPALARAAQHAPVVVTAAPADCSLQLNLTGTAKYASSCDIAKAALTNAGIPYRNSVTGAGGLARVHVGGTALLSPDGRKLSALALAVAKKDFAGRLAAALRLAGYPDAADPAVVSYGRALLLLIVLGFAAAALYAPQAAALVELFPTRIRYTALSVPYHVGVGWFGGFLPAIAFAIVAATGNIYAGLWYPVIVAVAGFLLALLMLPETYRVDIE